jgi:hypothetical protein
MEELFSYYKEHNSWYLPETEEPKYIPILGIRTNEKNELCDIFKNNIGTLSFFDFTDLCVKLLTECKKFGINFKETKKLLKIEKEYNLDYSYYKKYEEIIIIINSRRERSRQRYEIIKSENEKNRQWPNFVGLKLNFKKEKFDMVSGWYIEYIKLYSSIIQTYVYTKYKSLIENHAELIYYLIPIAGLAFSDEMLNDYKDITSRDEFIHGDYTYLCNIFIPKYIIPHYLKTFIFLRKLHKMLNDNLRIGYYAIKLLKDSEYCTDIGEKIWNNHTPIIELFTPFEYDKELFDTIENFFITKHIRKARDTDKVIDEYRDMNYGVWIYTGYFYYLVKHEGYDINNLIGENANYYKEISDHPYKEQIFDFFNPPDKITYML